MGDSTSSGALFDPYVAPTRSPFTSLTALMEIPPQCTPCRTEERFTMILNGEKVTAVLRDRLLPEDLYLVLVKATAFAIARGGDYRGVPPGRAERDALVSVGVLPI